MSEYIHLKGQAAILDREKDLTALGRRFGVRDAGAQIKALLKDFSTSSKIPHLILPGNPAMGEFAVVLREYRLGRVPSRVLFPIDQTGELTVLASKEDRVHIALRVLDYLVDRNVFLALLSLKDVDFPIEVPSERTRSQFAIQRRQIRRSMPLLATLEATLATLGSRTRRNLRYYTRRAESQLGAVFHSGSQICEQDFLALNRNGTHPFAQGVAHRLYELSQEPNRFLAVLTINDGHSVSAIGGRQFEDQAIVDWQINDKHLKSYSLSTVARCLYLRYEIQRGTKLLSFEGGTPHSMQNSFSEETIVDVMAVRRPFPPRLVRRLVAAAVPRSNFISYILNDGKGSWQ